MLIKAHARIEQSSDKINPLYVAAQNGFKEVVRVLLDCVETYHHDEDTSAPVLDHAALPPGLKDRHRRRRGRGRRQRKRSNDLISDAQRRSRRRSVVSVAAAVGNKDIVKMLLRSGAEVNLDDGEEDVHPLFIACRKGDVDIVTSLLDAGAKVNSRRQKDGQTPLFMSIRKGHLNVAEVLLKAGADADTSNHDGHTPLCIAARAGRIDIVKALLLHNASAEKSNALVHACRHGHIEVVKILLAKSNYDDSALKSACGHAKEHGESDIVSLLEERIVG